jgi:hypothetical protein
MRFATALLLVLALVGCGAETEATGPPASSGDAEPAVTVQPSATEADPSELQAPRIVLQSPYGDQMAVQGSYCVQYVDDATGEGQGACNDSAAVSPRKVTAVAAGDEVRFVFAGAEIASPSGCHGDDTQDCIGSVRVKPLGCDERKVDRVPLALGPETRWMVDLQPGAYRLDVFGYFESDEGATGDVSGTLGLTVAGPKRWDALGVLAVDPALVCPSD